MRDSKAETIAKRISEAVRENPAAEEILNFYEKILLRGEELKERVPFVPANLADIEDEGSELPLFAGGDLLSHLDAFEEHFDSLIEISKDVNESLSKRVADIQAARARGKLKLLTLLEGLPNDFDEPLRKASRELSLDERALTFLLVNAARPFFEMAAAHAQKKTSLGERRGSSCPLCGMPPGIAEISGEEGIKFYSCSLCGLRWRGERIHCPYCNNVDHEKLRYIYAEEYPSHRAYLCEACRRYLKTKISKEAGAVLLPLVEDLATLHLDMLAEKEGFARGGISPLGI